MVLAAGAGTRLRPLTDQRPKALCPVNNVTLLDRALARVGPVANRVAVNAHYHADQIVDHLRGRDIHVSVEPGDEALGTAGAVGLLADWLAGAAVLIHNADAFHDTDPIPQLVEGWSGETCRLLVVADDERGDFGPWRFAGVSLLSASEAALPSEPGGLYEMVWRREWEERRLELVPFDGAYFDCGTPADYLAANLHASGGVTVVGPGAVVDGRADRCVIWPDARVEAGEHLVEVIRAPGPVTVSGRLER